MISQHAMSHFCWVPPFRWIHPLLHTYMYHAMFSPRYVLFVDFLNSHISVEIPQTWTLHSACHLFLIYIYHHISILYNMYIYICIYFIITTTIIIIIIIMIITLYFTRFLGFQAMQLVLFDEAMQHLMKINRNSAGTSGTTNKIYGEYMVYITMKHRFFLSDSRSDLCLTRSCKHSLLWGIRFVFLVTRF